MSKEARDAWGELMFELEFMDAFFDKLRHLGPELDQLRDGDFSRNLEKTYRFLRETSAKIHDHANKTAWQGVMSPFDEKEKANTLTKIERTKSRMILDLNLLQTHELKRCFTGLEEVLFKTLGPPEPLEWKDLLNWFCPPTIDPETDHNLRRNARVEGTSQWIQDEQYYNEWVTNVGSILWLRGPRGIGKSVICSVIIDYLTTRTRRGAFDSVGIAFFYWDGTNPEKKQLDVIYGSLLRQLCSQAGFDRGEEVFSVCRDAMREEPKPTTGLLVSVLEKICSLFKDVYIILDGLDELEYSGHLVGTLSCRRGCHVLVSSRYSKFMESVLLDASIIEMPVAQVTSDIARYLDWKMGYEKRFHWLRPDMTALIKQTLLEKSCGIFFWVECQLKYVMSFHQNSARRLALSNFPPTLAEFYFEILTRCVKQPADLKLASTVLSLVLSSVRPLKLTELAFAASIDIEEGEWSEDETFDDPDAVVDVCGGLITIRDAESCGVVFSHPSVVDFLNCRVLPNGSSNPYFVESQEGHKRSLRACLIYLKSRLSADGPIESLDEMEQRASNDPFFPYAASVWLYHWGPGMEQAEDIQSLVGFILRRENGNFFASSQADMVVKNGDESLRRHLPNTEIEIPDTAERRH